MRTFSAFAFSVLIAAAPALAQGAAGTQGSPRAQAKADSIRRANAEKSGTVDTTQVQSAPRGLDLSLQREVFTYSQRGRRDPMVSLMNTGDIRPLVSEVKVISIVYDEEGPNHSAVLLNTVDKKTRYRVKVGQMLGRMKITQITRQEVVFTLSEFGFSRQQRLSIKPDTTAARTP